MTKRPTTDSLARVRALALLCVVSLAAVTCKLDTLTGPQTADGIPVVSVTGDSVVPLGSTTHLQTSIAVHGVASAFPVVWTSSNPAVATVDPTSGVVTPLAVGSVTMTATVTAQEVATSPFATFPIRVRYEGIAVSPVSVITAIGDTAGLGAQWTNGTDKPVDQVSASEISFVSRDTTVANVAGGTMLVARRNGTVWVVGTTTRDGLTDSVSVSVRQAPAHLSFGGATELDVGSLGIDRKIAAIATDSRNVPIPAGVAGIKWSSANSSVVTIDSATGVLRAHAADTTHVTATGGAQTQTILVRVKQVPTAILRTAGDSQTTVAGANVPIAPAVTVVDSGGFGVPNAVVSFNATNGGSVGTASVTTDATGKATLSSWSLGPKAGADSLIAAAAGLSAVFVSQGTTGAATQLVFTADPVSTAAGVVLARVSVAAADANGNAVGSGTGTVTLALSSNPGSAAVGGTLTQPLVNGVATFDDLTLGTVANGYTLSASSAGLAGATSKPFTIFGAPSQLTFTAQPKSTSVTAPLSPAVTVAIEDAAGNLVTSATNTVKLSFAANPGNARLLGPTTATAVGGIAVFPGVSVDAAAIAYSLAATSDGLASAASATFDVTSVGAPSQLGFVAQPATAAANVTLPMVSVAVQDNHGATITTSDASVSLALGAGSPAGAVLHGTLTQTAVNGIAVFPDLVLQSAGSGQTLVATAVVSGATVRGTSQPFDVAAGSASALRFTSQPQTVNVGDAIAPAVEVAITDAFGNVISSATDSVFVSIAPGTGAPGAVLSGKVALPAVNGVARFTDLALNAAAAGYRLAATGTNLSSAVSAAFDVGAAGAATRLAFTVQPASGTSGTALPPVEVTVQDDKGNTVPVDGLAVSLASNSVADTLTGVVTVNTAAGVALFSGLTLRRANSDDRLLATAAGLPQAASHSFSISAGATAGLVVLTQPPASAGAGSALAPPPRIGIADAAGNVVTTSTAAVSMSLVPPSGTSGAFLAGKLTASAVNGVATFDSLVVTQPAAGYSLAASSSGLTGVTTDVFTVGGAAASKLVFQTLPTGPIIAHDPQTYTVAVEDANGVIVANATNSITISLSAGPSGATLTGTTTLQAVNGVATFSDLELSEVGSGYTLTATSTGLVPATSGQIAATFSTQSPVLKFLQAPITTPVGQQIPAMEVAIVDPFGNTVTTASALVSLSLDATSPPGGTLSGTLAQATSAGVATFTGVSIAPIAIGYHLRASANGYAAIVSPAFDVTGGTHLAFTTQPSTVASTAHILPAVQVTVLDAGNSAVSAATNLVTVALASGHGTNGAQLTGTLTRAAVNGVATFDDLSVDSAGSGYKLVAASNGLTSDSSVVFDVLASTSTRLAFRVQPTDLAPHQAFVPLQVAITDDEGNVVPTATDAVTLSVLPGTGAPGATLGGSVTQSAVNGVATFPGVSVSTASSTWYRLQASAVNLTATASNVFVVQIGPPVQLVFTTQPTTVAEANPFSPDIQVSVADSAGNTSSTATTQVTLGITSGTGTLGASLIGPVTVGASNGTATFHGDSIFRPGTGYTLTASASGLRSAVSAAFDVVAVPVALRFSVQPASATGGAIIGPAVQVSEVDANGDVVAGAHDSVSVALAAAGGATLGGTLRVQAVNGVATFADLTVDRIGDYVLTASASALPTISSNGFTISTGPADHLAFPRLTAGPVLAETPGSIGDVIVQEVDKGGNVVTGGTAVITISLDPATGPSGATLSGTTTLTAVNGVVTFSDLMIDKAGTGYQFEATSPGLTGVTEAQFEVIPGAPTHMAFGVAPKSTFLNAPLNPDSSVTVEILDNGNNVVTGSSGLVSFSIASPPASASLTGTTTVRAVNGVATLPADVRISGTSGSYAITVSDDEAGVATLTSTSFAVAPFSTSSQLAWLVQPSAVGVSTPQTPAPQVAIEDQYGNIVTTATDSIAIAFTANPSGANLSNGGARAVNGIATLSNLLIDAAGSGFIYGATDVTNLSLAPASSVGFDVGGGDLTASAGVISRAAPVLAGRSR